MNANFFHIDEDGIGYAIDGDHIMAARADEFTNIQESPCGFGYTQEEARAELLQAEA